MRIHALVITAGLWSVSAFAQNGIVHVTGAMRNTMFNGQLGALVGMDSTATEGAYGIGPMAFLRGELLVMDGHCFVATATSDSTMLVEERTDVGAPFFVHQHVQAWRQIAIPDTVTDLLSLDAYLTSSFGAAETPFAFRMHGDFLRVDAHIVDVTPGSEIHGPEDAHRDMKHYGIVSKEADAIGFFSTRHRTVFTHHDANIHVHAITVDRNWMGHVEALRFDPRNMVLSIALP